MAKKNYLIHLVLIIFSLLCLVQNQEQEKTEWLQFWDKDGGVNKTMTNVKAEKRYAIEFNSTSIDYTGPLYLKIEVIPEPGDIPPLLCFSSDDPYCETRDILSRNPTGKSVVVWAKKEQFKDQKNEPYFVVTCPNKASTCSYEIQASGADYATFTPDFVYSYLVTKKNKDYMRFQIDKTGLSIEQRLTVCLYGSSSATLRFSDSAEIIQNGNIQCINIKITENDLNDKDFGKMSVKDAKEGEYLTLSAHTYKIKGEKSGIANSNYILPNGPIISGFFYSENTYEECFPISKEIFDKSSDKLYITGQIHSKYGWFFLEDKDGKWIESTDEEIIDGQLTFVLERQPEDRLICFEIPHSFQGEEKLNYEQDFIMFSFQIIDYDKLIAPFVYTEPMIIGENYRKLLPKGKISYYYGTNAISDITHDITLTRRKGLAQLYITECNNFPNCSFSKEDLPDLNKYSVSTVNNQKIWITKNFLSSAIGTQKHAMVVYCVDNELNDDYCEFDLNIIAKGQDIKLIENEKFSKYVDNGVGNLIVDLQRNRIIERVTIDIMIYNGDISFSIMETNLDYEQLYLSNKVVFNIYKPKEVLEKVTIAYKAILNSFFTIRYSVDSDNKEQSEEIVTSGESYLIQINPTSSTKSKNVYMNNIFGEKSAFMTNFYELNCEFEIKRPSMETEFTFIDGYTQENIEAGMIPHGYYDYEIKIKEVDNSNYNNKMCMLYISGYEVDDRTNEREIIVPSNINQQIIFTEYFTKIKYTYPVANTNKEFIIYIKVINRAYYKLSGYLNGKILETINNYQIESTSSFFISAMDLRDFCKDVQLCVFNLEIEMTKKIEQIVPKLEVTFRDVLNVPTYIQKGINKIDYVCGDKFYYLYTEIGRNDIVEITLNFLREYGNIWAKVVRKDIKIPQSEANWRGLYRMPGPAWDDGLPYDYYTKKVNIGSEYTKDCVNGCYLLMTIQITDIGDYVPDYIYYFFSIQVKVHPNKESYTDIPKIKINLDEFIIGSLDTTELSDRYISDFYEIYLPYDSEKVEFDLQSNVVGLYINIGDTRPTVSSADFIFNSPGRDSIFSITKQQILEIVKKKGIILINEASIKDLNLVIGIWTNKTDSVRYELYSLNVHQNTEENEYIEILESSSDQKIVCKPRQIKHGYDTLYRCLFMITYNYDSSIKSPLYVHGYSTNPDSSVNLYGSFIDSNIYNEYDIDKLKSLIPSEDNAEYNTYSQDTNYIYISNLPYNKYFFINIDSNFPDDIILINSIPLFNLLEKSKYEIYPNSFTEQIYSLTSEKIKLIFPKEEGIEVSIEVLSGEAQLYWEGQEDLFRLKGQGDRITLFSGYEHKNLLINKINSSFTRDMEDPGFLFKIKYKERAKGFNFDEVEYSKSTELSYIDTDLPAVLYSNLKDIIIRDLLISITFKDNPDDTSGEISESPMLFQSTILKEDIIYALKMKKDIDIVPLEEDSVYGIYDGALRTALIYLSNETINEYNIDESDNPYLYLRIDKNNSNGQISYTKFNIETQIYGINELISPIENVYHYGKFGKDRDIIFYPLKSVKDKEYIRVIIAFNSDNFDFCINNLPNNKQNMTFDYWRTSKERSKIILTFKRKTNEYGLYLTIFRKDNSERNEQLGNYVFKYINEKAETDFFDYKTMSNNISCYFNSDKIRCVFNQVHVDKGRADITYSLKIVDKSNHINGEEINTIAITESPSHIYYVRNPTHGADGDSDKIEITATGFFRNWGYINVIAKIQQNNIIEYSAYNGFINLRPEDDIEWIVFLEENNGFNRAMQNVKTNKRYAVEFESSSGQYTSPSYLKIEVTPESGNIPPLLCFSSDDSYCDERDNLVRNPTGKSVVVWAKKEQFNEHKNEPYFVVICPNNAETCTYKIEGSGADAAIFTPDFVYSYLVTNKNKYMNFQIDKTGLSIDKRLTVCLYGSSSVKLIFSDVNVTENGNIQCINIEITENDLNDVNFGRVTTKNANEGEYLTLSVHTYIINDEKSGIANDNFALPNGPIISGFIYSENTYEECFPISKEIFDKSSDKLYITGQIHTKYGWFFLEDKNGNWIESTDVEIIDGQLSYVLPKQTEDRLLCFEIPHSSPEEGKIYFEQDFIMFSFQIIDYDKLMVPFDYTEPMVIGENYRKLLPKGKIIYFYGGNIITFHKYDITLTRRKGLAELYKGECYKFPFCSYSEDYLKFLHKFEITTVNNQKIWMPIYYNSSALGTYKQVMVVYCEDNELNDDYCEFDIRMIDEEQSIKLIENQKFSKYVQKGTNNLVVDLQRNRIIERVTVDIMVFNGNISFSINETNLDYEQLYLSNKVVFNIYKPKEILEKVTIEYNAFVNSFFTIRYTVDSDNKEQLEETVTSGENYLIQINPTSNSKSKTIHMNNIFGEKSAFMTNFYELNCEFEIKRTSLDTNIALIDGYAQENIEAGMIQFGYYDYEIKIKKTDSSNYNNKMCMLYISGYEVDNRTNEREIIVPSNINQRIIFNEHFTKINYSYPIDYYNKDFILYFNVLDKAYYRITGYLNGAKLSILNQMETSISNSIYMNLSSLHYLCGETKLCAFTLEIEMIKTILQTNPKVEVTFREIVNTPTYLQKGINKIDFVCGNKYYYLYTELGKNDKSEITFNFFRYSGTIWAKIVKKDLKTPEEEANWRGMYRMPGPKWNDGLPYDEYTKKIKINSENTKDCVNGCYLLMTIQLTDIEEKIPDDAFHFFSIMVKMLSDKKTCTEMP